MGVFHWYLVGGVVVLRPQESLGPGQHGVQTDDGAGSLHVVQALTHRVLQTLLLRDIQHSHRQSVIGPFPA